MANFITQQVAILDVIFRFLSFFGCFSIIVLLLLQNEFLTIGIILGAHILLFHNV